MKEQIVYTIFRNAELIWARNFEVNDMQDGINKIKSTYEDIQKDNNVKNIKYNEKKLEFDSFDEKHIMMILEREGGKNNDF